MPRQTDHYGRPVNISSVDLINSLNAKIVNINFTKGAAGELAKLAAGTASGRSKLGDAISGIQIDPNDIKSIGKHIEDLVDVLEETNKGGAGKRGTDILRGGGTERGNKKAMTGLKEKTEDTSKSFAEMEKRMKGYAYAVGTTQTAMEKLTKAAKGLLSKKQMEAMAKGYSRFHKYDEGDRRRVTSGNKNLLDILETKGPDSKKFKRALISHAEDMSETSSKQDKASYKWERFKQASGRLSSATGAVAAPSSWMGGPDILGGKMSDYHEAMKDTLDWSRQIHASLFESFGTTGNARAKPGTLASLFHDTGVNDRAGMVEKTGQTDKTVQEQLNKNLKRGITDHTKINRLTQQGLAMGKIIGADAKSTADELADWAMNMGMTTDQTAKLAKNTQMVGRVTGITGDNLLQAVKSARELAEHMRDAGTLTDEAAKSMIQFSAAGKKFGTSKELNSLLSALSSSTNLYADEGISGLLFQAASRKGRLNELQTGSIMNTPGAAKDMAQGLREMMMTFTGGRDPKQLMKAAQGGDRNAQMLLMQANMAIETYTKGQVKGLGAMDRMVESFEEGTKTTDDKIGAIQKRLEKPFSMGPKEKKALELELQQLNEQKKLDASGKVQTSLMTMADKLHGGGSIEDIGGEAAVKKTLLEYQKTLEETQAAVGDEETKKRIQVAIDAVAKAQTGPLDPKKFQETMEKVNESVGDLPDIILKRRAQDSVTGADSKVEAANAKFRETIGTFATNLADKLGEGGLYTAKWVETVLTSLKDILGKLIEFGLALAGIIPAIAGLGGVLGGAIGGIAVAVGGIAGGLAAGLLAGFAAWKLGETIGNLILETQRLNEELAHGKVLDKKVEQAQTDMEERRRTSAKTLAETGNSAELERQLASLDKEISGVESQLETSQENKEKYSGWWSRHKNSPLEGHSGDIEAQNKYNNALSFIEAAPGKLERFKKSKEELSERLKQAKEAEKTLKELEPPAPKSDEGKFTPGGGTGGDYGDTPVASPTTPSMDDAAKKKQAEQLAATQVAGPAGKAADYLGNIKDNTGAMATETKLTRIEIGKLTEALGRFVAMQMPGGEKGKDKPNFWPTNVDMLEPGTGQPQRRPK
jgi:hypothetical protein